MWIFSFTTLKDVFSAKHKRNLRIQGEPKKKILQSLTNVLLLLELPTWHIIRKQANNQKRVSLCGLMATSKITNQLRTRWNILRQMEFFRLTSIRPRNIFKGRKHRSNLLGLYGGRTQDPHLFLIIKIQNTVIQSILSVFFQTHFAPKNTSYFSLSVWTTDKLGHRRGQKNIRKSGQRKTKLGNFPLQENDSLSIS